MEAVEIVLSLWCAVALSIVLFSLRAVDKKALTRAESTHPALAFALARADGSASPGTRAASAKTAREEAAVIHVHLSVGAPQDPDHERWLRHVMRRTASQIPRSNEHRGLQRLRLVRPLPLELPDVDDAYEDDTPAPEAPREPILPPPSTPSPLRPSRR